MASGVESGERTRITEDETPAVDEEKDVSFRDLVSRIHRFFCVTCNHRLSDLM
jgi:hypothetical protein